MKLGLFRFQPWLVLSVMAACSSPDPGDLTFVEPRSFAATEPGAPRSGATARPSDGAPSPSAEAAPSPEADRFFNGEAFAAGQPGSQDSKATATHPTGNPGQECLTCHAQGGAAATKPWAAAGTVYTKEQGGQPAPEGVEVRITNASGATLAKVYTDGAGNFAFERTGPLAGGIPANARVGVRDAARTSLMTQALTPADGKCNNPTCHGNTKRVALAR